MSVLTVPRIFFRGFSEWNPATTNNNDQWPTYDFVNAALNWSFLATQDPPITRQNASSLFPTWVQQLQTYTPSSGAAWQQPPAEWNYYGGNESTLYTTTTNQQTIVTGGQVAYDESTVTSDPVVNAAINILGDPYPGATTPTLPRLVDVNPDAFWNSNVYLRSVQLGDGTNPTRYLYGEIVPETRMCSRWLNVQRNLNADGKVEIAGVAGAVMQTCLPNATLRIDPAGSDLLTALDKGRHKPGMAGVMVRFCIYFTQYFTHGEFADCTTLTSQYTRLVQLWQQALQDGQTPLQNPAIAHVVGTIGVWADGELVSMPGGRYLVPVAGLVPNNVTETFQTPPSLGPAVAELHADERMLSLDFGSTIPEIDSTCAKADYGPLEVKVVLADGTTKLIGTLAPDTYGQARYEASAGILDLPLPACVEPSDIQRGSLQVLAGSTALLSETGLSASALTVQTDQRGLYVEQSGTGSLTIQVRQAGAVPTQPVKVLLQQYLPSPAPPGANAGAWTTPTTSQPPVIEFQNAPGNVITVPTSSDGTATVSFTPLQPGFPCIVFFPFLDGDPTPTPPQQVIPVYVSQLGALTIETAFYCSVRVMPFDNDLPLAFANLWNTTHSQDLAWRFVYDNILYLYDLIFPVMKYYAGLDLGNQAVVDATIGLIVQLTADEMRETTVYMPITRDLSIGKRVVLQMYAWLVEHNWPQLAIDLPAGFAGTPAESAAAPA